MTEIEIDIDIESERERERETDIELIRHGKFHAVSPATGAPPACSQGHTKKVFGEKTGWRLGEENQHAEAEQVCH